MRTKIPQNSSKKIPQNHRKVNRFVIERSSSIHNHRSGRAGVRTYLRRRRACQRAARPVARRRAGAASVEVAAQPRGPVGPGGPTPLFVVRRRPRGAPRPRPLRSRPSVRRRRGGLEADAVLAVGGGAAAEHLLPVDLDRGHRKAAAAAAAAAADRPAVGVRGEIGGVCARETGAGWEKKNGGCC
ncbi:hypothetical protein SEVIR_3G399350v4 [Setaria viridis]